MVISSGLGSGQLSRPVKKARKARKANPGLLDTWLIGPLLGLRFRLWTLAHTLGWTTNQPGLAGTVESCLCLCLCLVLSCISACVQLEAAQWLQMRIRAIQSNLWWLSTSATAGG